MQISSRKDAITAGVGQYFTGKQCRNGHLANRYTKSGTCVSCVAEAAAKSRGALHSGIVIPRAQIEAERLAKMQALTAERAEKTDALKRLIEIRVPVHLQDLATVFDTAVELCLAAYPCLDRADVYPDAAAIRGTPLYKVTVPPEHVELVRGVADALWAAHGVNVSSMADKVAAMVQAQADREADEPPEGWR